MNDDMYANPIYDVKKIILSYNSINDINIDIASKKLKEENIRKIERFDEKWIIEYDGTESEGALLPNLNGFFIFNNETDIEDRVKGGNFLCLYLRYAMTMSDDEYIERVYIPLKNWFSYRMLIRECNKIMERYTNKYEIFCPYHYYPNRDFMVLNVAGYKYTISCEFTNYYHPDFPRTTVKESIYDVFMHWFKEEENKNEC